MTTAQQNFDHAVDTALAAIGEQGEALKARAREIAKLRHALRAIELELCTVVGNKHETPRIRRALDIIEEALR